MDARTALEDIVRGVSKMASAAADALVKASALEVLDRVEALSRVSGLAPADRMALGVSLGIARRSFADEIVEVRWREAFEGAPERRTLVDAARIRQITLDRIKGAEGRSAAAEVVRDTYRFTPEWHHLPQGDGPHIEIISPESWGGLYQVAISRSRKQGQDGMEFDARTARRASLELQAEQADAVRRLLHPSDVVKTYDLISNEDGVVWSPLRFQAWKDDIAGMARLYENGTLRGLGRMARDKLTDRVGMLVECPVNDDADYPNPDDIFLFNTETGLRLECCDWETKDGGVAPMLVTFVPYERIASAPGVSAALARVSPQSNLPERA